MKALRKIKRNRLWIGINLLGLTIAFIISIFVISHVSHELSYDKFHTNSERIHRITLEMKLGDYEIHAARIGHTISTDEFPEIEMVLRLSPFKNAIVQVQESRFNSTRVFNCDSTFFDFFDYELISGDPNGLNEPRKAIINESIALKYFGNTNCIGKIVKIQHQQNPELTEYTIVGVMPDMPANTHFHVDILCAYDEPETFNGWAYTYLLMQDGISISDFEQKVNEFIKKERPQEPGNYVHYHFQPIEDIHLHSQKEREMEANGDIKSIYILLGGLFVVLGIAFLNFFNLSRVKFISQLKVLSIKRVNGASKRHLFIESMRDSASLGLASVGIGALISTYLHNIFPVQFSTQLLLLISIVFLSIVVIIGILPITFLHRKIGAQNVFSKTLSYRGTLVFQFLLACLSISLSITMIRQMNSLYDKHPQADNVNIITLPQCQWDVVQNFDLLRNELMKSSSIEDVTAAMEEPAGDILDGTGVMFESLSKEININLFTALPNFFEFMGIQPIAGDISNFKTQTNEWENMAIQLGNMEQYDYGDAETIEHYRESVSEHQDGLIINESAMKVLGIENAEEAIGKPLYMNQGMKYAFPDGHIVAIIPDFHYTNLHNEEVPLVIAPRRFSNYCILVKASTGNLTEATKTLNKVWSDINPGYPIEYEFITDSYKKVYLPEIIQMRVMIFLSIISILLAGLGIFAMTTFNLQKRIKEIGIRKVNGAGTMELIKMMNLEILKWILPASILSIPLSIFIIQKWLSNFAYSVKVEWWVYAVSIASCLIFATVLVSLICRKAARRNPIESLRYE